MTLDYTRTRRRRVSEVELLLKKMELLEKTATLNAKIDHAVKEEEELTLMKNQIHEVLEYFREPEHDVQQIEQSKSSYLNLSRIKMFFLFFKPRSFWGWVVSFYFYYMPVAFIATIPNIYKGYQNPQELLGIIIGAVFFMVLLSRLGNWLHKRNLAKEELRIKT